MTCLVERYVDLERGKGLAEFEERTCLVERYVDLERGKGLAEFEERTCLVEQYVHLVTAGLPYLKKWYV